MKKISVVLALLMLFTAFFGEFAHAQERKKWSPQAKGAVIGGLGGAAAGAIINKRNRAVGGVIGGAAGAGIGYAVGKRADNRRKAREAEAARAVAAHRAAAERSAARRASASKATASAASAKPAAANAMTSDDIYMLNTAMVATPTVDGVSYLRNDGASAAAYPSSEVRRKSW